VAVAIALAPWTSAAGLDASAFTLVTGLRSSTYADTAHHDVSYTFSIVNGSGRPVYVRDLGRSNGAFILVRSPGWGRAVRVPAHGSTTVTVRFHVARCAPLPVGSNALTLQASFTRARWRTVNLEMNVPGGWGRSLARAACGAGARG
jgi:hypothetical protein